MGMGVGEAHEAELQVYLDMLRDLDKKREGLDFEIHDMLEEMDTAASFKDIENAKIEDIPKDSKVGQLIERLIMRQREIDEN